MRKFTQVKKLDHFLTKAEKLFVMSAMYLSMSIVYCTKVMKSAN